MSPLYVAVTLFVPVVEKVEDNCATPAAGVPALRSAAVPETGPVPSVVEPDLKVTVPVGPAPLLVVEIVAVKTSGWFAGVVEGAAAAIAVEACVMDTASAVEVLAL